MNKVSVIIPVYNVESYVRESLLSALDQTFEDLEYVIVDDCSTDRSMDVVRGIVKGHPRSKDVHIYRHEQNRGLSAARNTGMSKATGKYIFFMDSDDEITLDCIEKHFNAITKNNACFSIANINLVGVKSIHIKDFSAHCRQKDLLSSFFLREWNVSACNKLFLKDFINQNHLLFQEGLLQEDILWTYRVCLFADRAAWIEDRTYSYKIRNNSITRSKNSSRKIESLLYILNTMVDDWEKGIINDKYKKAFSSMINFYRLNTSLLLLNYAGGKEEAESYYKRLNSGCLASLSFDVQSLILRLPFSLFKCIMKPIYYLYKVVG